MKTIECIDPTCTGVPTGRPQLSTWAMDVYFCSECKRTFSVPTRLGKLRDFAPAVIAGCAVIGVGMEINHHDISTDFSGPDDIFGGSI